MILPDFIRWCDFRGVLGVREGFLIEDLERLALKHLIPTFDAELRPVALPDWPEEQHDAAYDWPNLSPEEQYDAAYDGPGTPEERYEAAYNWPDLSTEEGRREFGRFQFDTLRVIRALAVEGEPMSELARAYLEAERQKIQAAKEEAEQAKAEAEAAKSEAYWLERFKTAAREGLTPEEVAAKRRKPDYSDQRENIDGEAAHALYKTGRYPYPVLARIHNDASGYGLEGDNLKRLERRIGNKARDFARGD